MARFKGQNLYINDNDQIYFGDNQEGALWYDGSDLRLTNTISGALATEPYHLVQKSYVDTALATVTGTAQEDYEILITSTDSPYYITDEDYIIFCDTVSGSIVLNLPIGTGGRAFNIKNIGTSENDVVLTPSGVNEIFSGGPGVAFNIKDGEVFDIHFNSIGGWW